MVRVKHTVTARDSDKAVMVPGKCRIVCARIQNKRSRDQQHGEGATPALMRLCGALLPQLSRCDRYY